MQPSVPKKFFISQKIRPKKSLGQSFIKDPYVLECIGKIAELSKEDEALEVGAGLGALTVFLAGSVKRVVAVEKDERFVERLRQTLSHLKNVEIICGDVLQLNLREFYRGNKIKVVSNLPYSVSSSILLRLLEERDIFSLLTVMVQREVGERICSLPGGKHYGSLSVFIQMYMDATVELHVSPEAFWPRPGVHSVVVKLIPLRSPRVYVSDGELFSKIVRAAFSSRRKMLGNSLLSIFPKEKVEEILGASEIDRKRRAETLSVEEFGRLVQSTSKVSLHM
jgi:16S rRNA (adenine1518-N6/adenine1519-N6)-dimethyltransferase